MPVVIARIKLEWLSGGWQPYTSQPVETDRSRVMREIVGQLRGMVLEAMNIQDDRRRTIGDIILRVEPTHSWSENTPDLWVDIVPMDVDSSWEGRKVRRWEIARDVSGEIFHYLDQDKFLAGPRPTYDVACAPEGNSGISRDSFGVMTGNWGVPDLPDPAGTNLSGIRVFPGSGYAE